MRNVWSTIVTALPPSKDEQVQNARLAYFIISSTLVLNVISIALNFLFSPTSYDISLNWITGVVQIALLYRVRQGHVQQAGVIAAIYSWFVITNAAYHIDGLLNPIITLYVLPILFAGLLVSVRAGLGLTLLCIFTAILFAVSAQRNIYPQIAGQVALGTRLGYYVVLFGFTGVTVYLSVGTVQSALDRVRSSEAETRERNLQLQAEIEKREAAQKELKESELRWRFALEGSGTGVWDMNLESGEIYRSPHYLELLGYTSATEKDLPEFTEVIHPDDFETAQLKRKTFFENQMTSYENEMRIRCADGVYKWFLFRGKVIEHNADGQPHRFAGTITDITDRKQLETVLKISEQGYRSLFENNPNPMWVFDKETLRFIAVNDAAIALYGYSRAEFMTMSVRNIRPPEDIPRFDATILGPLPIWSAPELWRHLTREGKILHVEITGHETVFQGKDARLILIKDLTAQKEVEASLRLSQDLFNRVFEMVPVGVAISRMEDGRYISVNPHMATMLDYQPEEMIGHTSVELNITDHTLRERYVETIRNTPTATAVKLNLRVNTRSGRNVDILAYTQLLEMNNDEVLLWIVVDVTELKRTERERLQIELLQSELDKQREVVELKERFISSVSHEFRSPLAIILSGTGILRLYDAKFTAEQRVERLEKIETQIHYLNDLLDRVLTLGKARAGKLQFKPREINLVGFCRDLFEDFHLSDKEQHQFMFEASGDFSDAHMDEKLLQHILMNLISNAVKYSPAGKDIRLHLSREDGNVIIQVSDQGIGIPEEEQQHVFEPFFRSQNAISIKGTGLGLAITKESVDAHAGSITWHSQVGQGTTFIVKLPGGFEPASNPTQD